METDHRKPDCAKCGKYYGSPERGLCTYCYDAWCRENGHPTTSKSPKAPRNPNRIVSKVLEGDVAASTLEPMLVSDSLLAQLKALLKNHAYTPEHFLKTIREVGIVESGCGTPHKLFMAKQAVELMNERKTRVHDEKQGWVWEHVICHLVADYWNIPAEFRVGHCYYSDWGTPPQYSDNVVECRAQMVKRCTDRLSMMYRQTSYYR